MEWISITLFERVDSVVHLVGHTVISRTITVGDPGGFYYLEAADEF